jgi:histidinol dehydrogenase
VTPLRRIRSSEPDFTARRLELCRRGRLPAEEDHVEEEARAIVAEVRARGDAALRDYTERFDRRAPDPATGTYELSTARWDAAAAEVDPEVARALERAAERIAAFHAPQRTAGYEIDGGALALRVVPLDRVGIYAPGGTAAISTDDG